MATAKVNVFISYAPEDRRALDKLLKWLYPMRDEVNLWYNRPPHPPEEFSLPWQLLLFWYYPPDQRSAYARVYRAQRNHAHVYLFLTSYNSLSNKGVEEDIETAVTRRGAGDDFLGPFIYPVLLSPSRWQEVSRLAGFKPMNSGKPLSALKVEDEGYLAITEELSALIKLLQSRLQEEKFYQSRLTQPVAGGAVLSAGNLVRAENREEPLEFHEIPQFRPPEWLGWSILLFLFISVLNYLMPNRITQNSRLDRLPNARDHGPEYRRENPLAPTSDTITIPPPE